MSPSPGRRFISCTTAESVPLPVTTAGLADGQQYSVVVTGNGTLAAVVQEMNLLPGDGLMVYEGFAQ